MLDSRAMAWRYLLPADAEFTVVGGSASFRYAIELLKGESPHRVLVTVDQEASGLPDLEPFAGLVAINNPGFNSTRMQAEGFTGVRRFAVAPSMEDPRLFVPLGDRKVAAAALRLYAPQRFSAKLKHRVAWLATRTGFGWWYRDEMIVANRQGTPFDQLLRRMFGSASIPVAISTGTPSPRRTPKIAILDAAGGLRAHAKIALTEKTRLLLENEAWLLAGMADIPAAAPFVPALLMQGEIEGTFTTIQQGLPGTPDSPPFGNRHRQFLESLSIGRPKFAIDAAFVSNLSARMSRFPYQVENLWETLERATRILARTPIRQTVTHGDFAPWNLRRSDGAIYALDWEYGSLDGLPLLDEIHFRLQTGLLVRSWSPQRACEMLISFVNETRHTMGLCIQSRQAIVCVYLLDALIREHEGGVGHSDDHFRLREDLLTRFVNSCVWDWR